MNRGRVIMIMLKCSEELDQTLEDYERAEQKSKKKEVGGT